MKNWGKTSLISALVIAILFPFAQFSYARPRTVKTGDIQAQALSIDTLGNPQQVWVGNTYQTIQEAVDSITDASASKPYMVRIPPGVYDETVTLQPYVGLQGAGTHATRIERSGVLEVGVYPENQSIISDLSIKTTSATGKCLLLYNASNITFYVRDVYLESLADLIWIGGLSSNLTGYFWNITAKTSFDGFAVFDGLTELYIFNSAIEMAGNTQNGSALLAAAPNVVIEMFGGRIFGAEAFGTKKKKAVEASNGTGIIRLYDVDIDLTNTSGSGDVSGVRSASSCTVEVFGGRIVTGIDSGTAYDLENSATINVYGTRYDDSKVSGTITGANLFGSVSWDPGNLADGAGETSAAITVTGAAFGDPVVVTAPYDMQGLLAHAYVSADNTIKIRIQNETTGAIDLASGTWKVRVLKQP